MMIVTPVQPTPKRSSVPRSDGKIITANRSLNFLSPLKADDESKQIRDNNLQNSATKRILVVDDDVTSPSSHVQMVERDYSKMYRTRLRKYQQMIASLPNLFTLIQCIFQSTNCSSITKQELVHKIISEDVWIDETSEAEEKLDLLEELVPDWIQKKLVPSGDLLYSIGKVSDLDSIRARLIEAV